MAGIFFLGAFPRYSNFWVGSIELVGNDDLLGGGILVASIVVAVAERLKHHPSQRWRD